MKKFIAMTAATAMFAMPAMASKMTLSFANEDGTSVVMTFDNAAGTATVEGQEGSFPFTYDEATQTLCGDATGEGEVCATFADANSEPAVGDTSAYTTSDGGSGTATVMALAE